MNFAFYISGNAGTFKKILKNNSVSLKNTQLIISDSEPDKNLIKHLEPLNIKCIFRKYDLHFSDFMLKELLNNKIDYCFCFGHHILKGDIINVFKNKIINFHPSILPLYPGVKSIDQAIKDNKSILIGNTAHFIDKGTDTGPIIMQSIAPKSLFESNGYDGVINLQLPMLDFIYKKLLKNQIIINNKKVTINDTKCTPQFFYNEI
tara:strand:- start:12079 stop:12693 length:615 start_codon:yes stop_codon:yes gene_type:complete